LPRSFARSELEKIDACNTLAAPPRFARRAMFRHPIDGSSRPCGYHNERRALLDQNAGAEANRYLASMMIAVGFLI
jgi:hypothetical protein